MGIYFGAQMREAGDYPYTLPLEHPRSQERLGWKAAPPADMKRLIASLRAPE